MSASFHRAAERGADLATTMTLASKPLALDVQPTTNYGRMLVGRRPDTLEVLAAGWDNAENRRHALEWLQSGLRIEFVPRNVIDQLLLKSYLHIFSTRQVVGELLSPQAARSALAGY